MSDPPYSAPQDNGNHPVKRTGRRVLLTLLGVLVIGALLAALMLPAVRSSPQAARRNQCANQLRQIAIALLTYQDVHGALPPAYTVDANGKPLHSWRTLILPYTEESALYKRIDLSKPWDDPANAEAFKTAVPFYQCPSADIPENHTTYLACVAPNGCFRPAEPRKPSEITDEKSETLILIEVATDQSIPWMAPMDADEALILNLGPESKLAHLRGMSAAFCDGSVTFLLDDTPAAERRAMISIAGDDGPIERSED